MGKNVNINVEYLTRVEGHGNIVVNVKNGMLETCRLDIVESPRFFEGMLRGRSIFEAQHITSRICGICACGHSLASIQAAEDALGITPTEQTVKLRKFLLDIEILDSHLLHIYVLAAPDLLGVKSFIPLIRTHNDVVRRALRMKKTCNDVCDILVGRHVHPISAIIGGFTKLPRPRDINAMVMGIHGDNMLPLVRLANVSGIPVTDLISADRLAEIVKRTQHGGAEIVNHLKTGSAFYTPGLAAVEMAEAVLNDSKRLLPCAAYLDGEFGFSGCFLGVPVVLGSEGVERIVEFELTAEEKEAMVVSEQAVRGQMAATGL